MVGGKVPDLLKRGMVQAFGPVLEEGQEPRFAEEEQIFRIVIFRQLHEGNQIPVDRPVATAVRYLTLAEGQDEEELVHAFEPESGYAEAAFGPAGPDAVRFSLPFDGDFHDVADVARGGFGGFLVEAPHFPEILAQYQQGFFAVADFGFFHEDPFRYVEH
jgi:hypothetical protein